MPAKKTNRDPLDKIRSLSSSQARRRLGALLASLPSNGPVVITRNKRAIAILSPAPAKPTDNLGQLAALYAGGGIEWRKLADETGASFGDLLLELARQKLALPAVTAKKSPKQVALFHEVLRRARR